MWRGCSAWAWAWVWVWVGAGLPYLILTHSTSSDPHLNPGKAAALLTSLRQQDGPQELSNHLALEVLGGEEAARTIAQKYGLHYIRQVFSDPPVYHLHNPLNSTYHQHHHHHRGRRSNPDMVELLAGEPGVQWVYQQEALLRDKRHQVPGDGPARHRHRPGTHEAPPRTSSGRTSEHTYENMKRWMKEEELGLSKFNNIPSSKKTNAKKTSKRSDVLRLKDDQSGSPEFNDPFFKDQWYLLNTGQLGRPGCDLNVTGAWRQGYTGQGLTLSILDDGFQTTNADLADNYDPSISYSLVRDGQPEDDPSPRLDPPVFSNSHGTYCAGVAAAVANNGVCGVGVAYKARVGGVRIVDGTVTDVQEATALSRHVDKVAVFSASWGPSDDGMHIEGPGRLASMALHLGVAGGRGGLGTIYVWASGNGGLLGDNCNLDGYASSIYTLTVTALTDLGASTFYGERCASVMAGVFVGGRHNLQMSLLDVSKTTMRVVVPELDGHCSQKFQGSSAAAPLMAGVVALTLQANPRLGWRDVQHLVVETAEPTATALTEDGWHTNARGKKFHLMQGFGAVDAGRMVEAATTWRNVGPQKTEHLPVFEGERNIARHAWVNVSHELPGSSPLSAVEHVVATVTLRHHQRCLLEIYIVSPAGTESQVLTHRPHDNHTTGLHEWGFMSVHLWGERPTGAWRVAFRSDSAEQGWLKKVDLTVYGY